MRRRTGPADGADPNPFTTAGALAEFEQDAAAAGGTLDKVIAMHREHAASGGESDALVSTYMGLNLVDPGSLASLLAVAVARLAREEARDG